MGGRNVMYKQDNVNELSLYDILEGLIWYFCIRSKDHYFQSEYYDQPVVFRYNDDGVSIVEVYYLGQQNRWTLLFADYKHVRRIVPMIVKWLNDTYLSYLPTKTPNRSPRRTRRQRRRLSLSRQRALLQKRNPLTTNLGYNRL